MWLYQAEPRRWTVKKQNKTKQQQTQPKHEEMKTQSEKRKRLTWSWCWIQSQCLPALWPVVLRVASSPAWQWGAALGPAPLPHPAHHSQYNWGHQHATVNTRITSTSGVTSPPRQEDNAPRWGNGYTQVGKWLHTPPSHPTLGEPQSFSWQTYRWHTWTHISTPTQTAADNNGDVLGDHGGGGGGGGE